MGTAVEQVHLAQNQEGETEQGFLLPGVHFEGNADDSRQDPDGESTQEETDAGNGEGRKSGERHFDGNCVTAPEDGDERFDLEETDASSEGVAQAVKF